MIQCSFQIPPGINNGRSFDRNGRKRNSVQTDRVDGRSDRIFFHVDQILPDGNAATENSEGDGQNPKETFPEIIGRRQIGEPMRRGRGAECFDSQCPFVQRHL